MNSLSSIRTSTRLQCKYFRTLSHPSVTFQWDSKTEWSVGLVNRCLHSPFPVISINLVPTSNSVVALIVRGKVVLLFPFFYIEAFFGVNVPRRHIVLTCRLVSYSLASEFFSSMTTKNANEDTRSSNVSTFRVNFFFSLHFVYIHMYTALCTRRGNGFQHHFLIASVRKFHQQPGIPASSNLNIRKITSKKTHTPKTK